MDEQKPDTAQTQNTKINSTFTPAAQPVPEGNRAPAIPSQQNEKQGKKANRIYIIIAIFFLILILGELGFVFVYHHSLLTI